MRPALIQDTQLHLSPGTPTLIWTPRPANTRENQMVKGMSKNIVNRSQCNMAPSEPSFSTTARHEYPKTPEDQDCDLKSQVMNMREVFNKDINKSLSEIRKTQ